MENYNYNGSTEYKKATRFLETGVTVGVRKRSQEKSLLNYVKRFKLSLDLNKIYF